METIYRIAKIAVLAWLGVSLITCSKTFAEERLVNTNPPAAFVVIGNGGTAQEGEELAEHISYLLGEMTEWRHKRSTRDTQIHIILATNPTEVSWSGTPKQLLMQGHEVLELIKFQATCNDLVLAWKQVETTARITMPSSVQLIGIGPMIHAGFPCNEGDNIIRLPQPVPNDLVLGQLAMEAQRLLLLGVHADQDDIYLDHFADIGLMKKVRDGALRFDLLDMARARAVQGYVLGGRK